MNTSAQRLREGLQELPVFDIHSHFGNYGYWQAKHLADLVSYHWLSIELGRAAGTVFSSRPGNDPDAYMEHTAPWFRYVRHSANHHALISMLRELYGFRDPTITPENWRSLDQRIRERSTDGAWQQQVLDRAGIRKVMVTASDGVPDASARFLPYEYGEHFCAPTTPAALARAFGKEIPADVDALAETVRNHVTALATAGNRAMHLWLPHWSFRHVSRARAAEAWRTVQAGTADPADQQALTDYCTRLVTQICGETGIVMQFFHGTQQYNDIFEQGYAGACNLTFSRGLATLAAEQPDTRMDLFLSTRIPGHEAATLARITPNLSISGAWWQGFTPSTLSEFFRDRLEILPYNTWNAFYSDGYLVEWIYAKRQLTLQRLAMVLSDLMQEDYLDEELALDIARHVLWENPLRWYRVDAPPQSSNS